MNTAGGRRHASWAKLVSLAIIATAFYFGLDTIKRRSNLPATDDATIDTDVVHVASAVGDRIIDIPIAENDRVVRGDLLFQIDPEPSGTALPSRRAILQFFWPPA